MMRRPQKRSRVVPQNPALPGQNSLSDRQSSEVRPDRNAGSPAEISPRRLPPPLPKQEQQNAAASVNVVNLQKRVAGVLPIAIDVPHAGTSFRFVRPLVVNEETKVTFTYKTK